MPIQPEDVEKLKSSCKSSASRVLLPGEEGYAISIKRWTVTAEKRAGIVVQAACAEDVSAGVQFAQQHHLDVAVCCGGHSTSGSSSTEGGLLIDLSKMRAVTVEPQAMTIDAQGGCLWSDIDLAAAEYELATVGGTVNHTGIGGLALGGGYGWLTGWYGLVIDVILEVEFVLADGRIVVCSESQETDLFWAAKGAGASFGVATRIKFKAFEQKGSVWAGVMIYPPDKLEEIIKLSNHITDVTTGEAQTCVIYGVMPPDNNPALIVALFYNGPTPKALEFYDAHIQLGPMINTCTEMPYSKLNSIFNEMSDHGARRTMKGTAISLPVDMAFAQSILDELISFVSKLPDAADTKILLEGWSYGATNKTPQTAQAFANRGEYWNVVINAHWKDPNNDTIVRDWVRNFSKRIAAQFTVQHAGKGNGVGQYGNYDGISSSHGKEIFGVNYEKVLEFKKKYDPTDVFNKSVKIF